MKRTQIPLFSDTIFAFSASFFLAFCLFRYLGIVLWASLAAAIVSGAAFAAICFLYLRAKLEAKYLLAKDEAEKERLMLHLTLDSAENTRRLFCKLLKAEQCEVERKNGALRIGNTLVFPIFTMQPVSADEIAKLIKRPFEGEKEVYCNALSPEAKDLCRRFSLSYTEGRDLYLRLKRADLLPKSYLCAPVKRRHFAERVKSLFARGLSHPYFLAGIGLLAFGLFTPYKLYYLLAGGALLLLALLVRLFGPLPQKRGN